MHDERLTTNSPIQHGDRVVVIGAGKSGDAAVRLLVVLGAQVILLDKNPDNISDELREFAAAFDVTIDCNEHSAEQFAGAALVVPSPGVPIHVLAPLLKEAGNPPCMGEMELALHFVEEPILAITGTSGKTSTVTMAAEMLKAAGKEIFVGGNIGTPLCSYVLDGVKADVVVLEVSSFQLLNANILRPRVAVLLNLSENHLDYHKNMEEYTNAKFNIFARQNFSDTAILPEELMSEYLHRNLRGRLQVIPTEGRFSPGKLIGKHSSRNAEAAFLATSVFGVTEEDAEKALEGFSPLRHRLERVGTYKGVTYINDSKCTTVDALRVALEAFTSSVILLAGGKFKGGDLASLRPLIRSKVKAVVLFGASRAVFDEAWANLVPMTWDTNLELAMARVREIASVGDTVLLSPATASYDLYTNYEQRGDHFCRLVKDNQ